jgi:hypothetical protein
VAKSAIDVISPAFSHARQQLFEPFRFGQWARIALLAMATGELSSGGGCHSVNIPSNFPTHQQQNDFLSRAPSPSELLKAIDPAVIGTLLLVAVIGFVVLLFTFLYVSSVSRFMLYETIVTRQCDLGPSWDRWHGQGMRYFFWQLALALFSMALAAVMLGPLLLLLWHAAKNQSAPSGAEILAYLPLLLIFGAISLVFLLISVLTKDFVVPIMALDGVGVIEGWRRLLASMRSDAGNYAGYVLMKIVLSIGASIIFGIVGFLVLLVLMIPVAIVAAAIGISAHATGFTWDASTITLVVVAGTVALGAMLYAIALVCVPVAIFFPAYALYFLAERYAGLAEKLRAAAPVSPPLQAWAVPPPPAPIG